MHRANLTVPRPDSELPTNFSSILLVPRGPFVKKLQHVLATESGAPPLPDSETPLAERKPLPVENIWKPHFLITHWNQGAGFSSSRTAGSASSATALIETSLAQRRTYNSHAALSAPGLELLEWRAGFRDGHWYGVKPPRAVVGHTVYISAQHSRSYFFKISGRVLGRGALLPLFCIAAQHLQPVVLTMLVMLALQAL